MKDLTSLELLSPCPIYVSNIGYFKPHTINDIIKIGESRYNQFLSLILADAQGLLSIMDKEEAYANLSGEDKAELNVFDLWTTAQDNIFTFVDMLSFFIDNTLIFDFTTKQIVVFETINGQDKVYGFINRLNYRDVQTVIKQLHNLQTNSNLEGKPKTKFAARILEKFKKHNQETKNKENKNLDLGNVIAAVSVQHNSYNLTNIWSLTVNQLYDQFFRLNTKLQIDTTAIRWAAYGKDSFDFSMWYKK